MDNFYLQGPNRFPNITFSALNLQKIIFFSGITYKINGFQYIVQVYI